MEREEDKIFFLSLVDMRFQYEEILLAHRFLCKRKKYCFSYKSVLYFFLIPNKYIIFSDFPCLETKNPHASPSCF